MTTSDAQRHDQLRRTAAQAVKIGRPSTLQLGGGEDFARLVGTMAELRRQVA